MAHRDDAFVDAYDVSKRLPDRSRNIPAACASCACGPGSGASGNDVFVTADEPSYTMALDVNREFDSDKLRYTYTSMVTPRTTYDYDFEDRQARAAQARAGARRLRPGQLRHRVRRGRRRATAPRCRCRIVYRKTTPRDGTRAAAAVSAMAPTARTYDPEFSYLPLVAARSRLGRTPSRTSAAARRWAAPGTRTASC